MKEKLVNILFKEAEQKGNHLQPGTMTMQELYDNKSTVWVNNANGDLRMINRRDFHIVDPEPLFPENKGWKPGAIVCDIDGVLNVIPKKVDGTDHRQCVELNDGSVAQWTEMNKTIHAKKVDAMFDLLRMYERQGKKIIFLTARGDTQRLVTEHFLVSGMGTTLFTTFMRGFSANDVSAPDLKAQMMQACILPYYDVELFIDDCPKNIAEMKRTCPEIKCLHVIN